MAAGTGDGACHEYAHPPHPIQRHESFVSRQGDLDLPLDLPAQVSEREARRRQRAQLVDDDVAVAVDRIAAVAVVLAAMDRNPDLVARPEQVVALRCTERRRCRMRCGVEGIVAVQPQGLSGAPAEGDFKRVALPGVIATYGRVPRLSASRQAKGLPAVVRQHLFGRMATFVGSFRDADKA